MRLWAAEDNSVSGRQMRSPYWEDLRAYEEFSSVKFTVILCQKETSENAEVFFLFFHEVTFYVSVTAFSIY